MIIIFNKNFMTLLIAIFLAILLLLIGIIFYNSHFSKHNEVISYNMIVKPIDRGVPDSNYIAFACNVDWGNEVLPDMLKILREKNVKITFFVTGRWVSTFPDLFKKIINEGHEIGNHGYQHINYNNLSLEKNMEQIKAAEEVIMEHTGKKPHLFAPPSGAYNENTLIAADRLGYKTVLWTIDTIDWRKGSTKDLIVKRVLDKENHKGAIVLMHPMEETVKALPILIDSLREKGLEVGRISDVLKD